MSDFILAPEKPTLSNGQKLGWENNDWVVLEPSYAEIQIKWQEIRDQRNQLLQDSDIFVLKSYENNVPLSEELKTYRQALRDITVQESPWDIVWPKL
jgi:hypothetical protein